MEVGAVKKLKCLSDRESSETMGALAAKPSKKQEPLQFLFDANEAPEEIIEHLLLCADFNTLLHCRLVCTRWFRIISEPHFWKAKCAQEHKFFPELLKETLDVLPFKVLARLYIKPPEVKTNLIVNPFGIDRLNGWDVLSKGGDGWAFEKPPAGADPVPVEAGFGDFTEVELGCFATSYHSCSKQQIIDLKNHGFIEEVLDTLPLVIEVRDWYAGRFDCGCVYEIKVELLNQEQEVVDSYEFRGEIRQWEGRHWHLVEARFSDIGSKQVRFIRFYHGGTDTLFWKGHYGSKMTASSVRILLEN